MEPTITKTLPFKGLYNLVTVKPKEKLKLERRKRKRKGEGGKRRGRDRDREISFKSKPTHSLTHPQVIPKCTNMFLF